MALDALSHQTTCQSLTLPKSTGTIDIKSIHSASVLALKRTLTTFDKVVSFVNLNGITVGMEQWQH